MFFKKCECMYLSELDIDKNSIVKKYMKVCTKHAADVFTEPFTRENYKYSKKKNIYYLRDTSSGKVKLRKTNSTSSTDSEDTISFGKYSGLEFSDVLSKDKSYCLNIVSITKRKKNIPCEMKAFSNFVKQQLTIG
jgi:hypothetical protein